MGCFSTCFGNCKRSHKRRHQHHHRRRVINTSPSLLDHLQTNQSVECLEVPHLIEEQDEIGKEKGGENQIDVTPDLINDVMKTEKSNSSERKKVTFDLNVKIYEDLPREDDEEDMNGVESKIEEVREENAQNKEKNVCFGNVCNSDSSTSSLFSFPPNHRYQNCRDSDDDLSSDGSDIDDYTDDDNDNDNDNDNDDYDYDEEVESEVKTDRFVRGEEQSSESLFSLPLESRKQDCGDKEVNSPMPLKGSSTNDTILDELDRNSSKYIDSVLNPVENLSQWKFVKARSKQASKDQGAKENMISGQDFCFPAKKAIGVDTSLSSWLVGSEGGTAKNYNNSRSSSVSVGNTPCDRNNCSPNKFEDRPILGALTIEELRQFSASNSPRKSPSKSPEDMPIIGSVGSYWSPQTADTASSTRSTKSKFRESAEVVWDSTPFETRLEKALEKEAKAGQIFAV